MGHPKKLERGEDKTSGVMRAQGARPQLDVAKLEYHLLRPHAQATPALLMAYEVWHEEWSAVFKELDGLEDLDSDEFTRLDQVGVLLYEGRVASVTGIRWLDLALPWSIRDSYFKKWPRHVLETLGSGLLGISSNTIIAKDWRGSTVHAGEEHMALKDVTIRLTLRRFADSTARVMVGIARNDRNMHRVAGDSGSRKMARITMHGIESDIVGWKRSDVTDLGDIVEQLWGRKVTVP